MMMFPMNGEMFFGGSFNFSVDFCVSSVTVGVSLTAASESGSGCALASSADLFFGQLRSIGSSWLPAASYVQTLGRGPLQCKSMGLSWGGATTVLGMLKLLDVRKVLGTFLSSTGSESFRLRWLGKDGILIWSTAVGVGMLVSTVQDVGGELAVSCRGRSSGKSAWPRATSVLYSSAVLGDGLEKCLSLGEHFMRCSAAETELLSQSPLPESSTILLPFSGGLVLWESPSFEDSPCFPFAPWTLSMYFPMTITIRPFLFLFLIIFILLLTAVGKAASLGLGFSAFSLSLTAGFLTSTASSLTLFRQPVSLSRTHFCCRARGRFQPGFAGLVAASWTLTTSLRREAWMSYMCGSGS